MVSYPIGEITGRRFVVMSIIFHKLERTKFVFTKRTEVRLGGVGHAYLAR